MNKNREWGKKCQGVILFGVVFEGLSEDTMFKEQPSWSKEARPVNE